MINQGSSVRGFDFQSPIPYHLYTTWFPQ